MGPRPDGSILVFGQNKYNEYMRTSINRRSSNRFSRFLKRSRSNVKKHFLKNGSGPRRADFRAIFQIFRTAQRSRIRHNIKNWISTRSNGHKREFHPENSRRGRVVFRVRALKKTEFPASHFNGGRYHNFRETIASRSGAYFDFFRFVFVKAMVASPAGTEAPKQLTAGFTFAYIYMCVSQ